MVTRTIAGAVDYGLGVAAAAGTYAAVAALSFLVNPVGWSWPRWPFIVFLALGAAYLFVYLVTCWATSGRTLGGVLMGVRVVHHGERVRLPRAMLRGLIVVAFPVGLFWSAVDHRSRSVQDLLTRTSVVYAWRSSAATV
ncbi:UNVERIFIED_CONTAM: hypothetical protein LK11_52715 [Mumia flava]